MQKYEKKKFAQSDIILVELWPFGAPLTVYTYTLLKTESFEIMNACVFSPPPLLLSNE